jgi:hypothetical protein
MDELWKSVESAIVAQVHAKNKKMQPATLDVIRKAFMNMKLSELFHPGDGITSDINSIMDKSFILEIRTSPTDNKYVGFDHSTNASELSSRCEFPVYQIIFEDTRQKLIFEFVGDDHEKLKSELEKIYPGCPIEQSNDDYTIGKRDYASYKETSSEFTKMQNTLDKIDHKLAYQCIKKELSSVDGTRRRATRFKLENKNHITDMVFGQIHININIENFNGDIIHGDQINIHNASSPTQEGLHKTCIENNPPMKNEYSKQYHTRISDMLDNPLSIHKQARIMRALKYQCEKKRKGVLWTKA